MTNPYGVCGGRCGIEIILFEYFGFRRRVLLHQQSIIICTVLLSEEEMDETVEPSNKTTCFPKSGTSKKLFYFTCLRVYQVETTVILDVSDVMQASIQNILLHV